MAKDRCVIGVEVAMLVSLWTTNIKVMVSFMIRLIIWDGRVFGKKESSYVCILIEMPYTDYMTFFKEVVF